MLLNLLLKNPKTTYLHSLLKICFFSLPSSNCKLFSHLLIIRPHLFQPSFKNQSKSFPSNVVPLSVKLYSPIKDLTPTPTLLPPFVSLFGSVAYHLDALAQSLLLKGLSV